MAFFGSETRSPYSGMGRNPAKRLGSCFDQIAHPCRKRSCSRGGLPLQSASSWKTRTKPPPTPCPDLWRSCEYLQLERDLSHAVKARSEAILQAVQTDNINERGNRIEQIITEAENVHTLQDLTRRLDSGPEIRIDIKTKVFGLASNPKAYNIDKVLRVFAAGNTLFCFFFVGIDRQSRLVATRLVSVLDRTILRATRIQFHWAGRNSRGVTQLTGDLTNVFNPRFRGVIEGAEAEAFLQHLIDLKPTAST